MSRTLVVDDGRTRRELLVIGTMMVGRDPECEISHGDPRLSRRHAEFSVTPQGVVVRDLKSRNGVRVNGQPVMQAVLQPGDVVQIAHLAVQFLDDAVATRASGAFRTMESGASSLAVSPALEDDRTRALTADHMRKASGRIAARPVVASHQVEDDRTRVLHTSSGHTAGGSAAQAQTVPMPELADLLLREPTVSIRPARATANVGIRWLLGQTWGRRVLLQGVLLAIIVFLITAVPMLAWQQQQFGRHAGEAWAALIPTLLASAAAGLMVSAVIARTTIRGRE